MFLFRKREAEQNREKGRGACSWSAAALSDLGRVRENNEDNYLLGGRINATSEDQSVCTWRGDGNWIAGVFDGMGGGEAGELAALYAARTFLAVAQEIAGAVPERQIRAAFQQANNAIVAQREKNRVLGTTATVALYWDGACKIFHLGDSRAYLFRQGELTKLTRDQTLAQMKLELGLYRSDSPEAEREKHQLTAFLGCDGSRENLKPLESGWLPLLPGDALLLCSDGLYDCCTDKEIARVLSGAKMPQDAAEALISLANRNGGVDNCTAILLQQNRGGER